MGNAASVIALTLKKHDAISLENCRSNDTLKRDSATTKRNSQYQSMSTNLLWYIAGCITTGKEPPLNSDAQIDNIKKPKYVDFYETSKKRLGRQNKEKNTREALVNELRMLGIDIKNGMSMQKIDRLMQEKHGSLYSSTYKRLKSILQTTDVETTWTVEMNDSLRKYMRHIINFAYEQFNKYKMKKDVLQLNKSKPNKDYNLKVKLYMALLLELDPVMVIERVIMDLKTKYVLVVVKDLLGQFGARLSKIVVPECDRDLYMDVHNRSLREGKLDLVATECLRMAERVKYRLRPALPMACSEDNLQLYDIGRFEKLACNISEIHAYVSPTNLNLQMQTCQYEPNFQVQLIVFTRTSATYVFDVTLLPNKQMEELSWAERLEEFSKYTKNLNKTNLHIIKVERMPLVYIQYNKLPSDKQTYTYIRTKGLGVGTLFMHSCNKGKKSGVARSKSRNRKMTPDDVKYRNSSAPDCSRLETENEPMYVTSLNNLYQIEYVKTPTAEDNKPHFEAHDIKHEEPYDIVDDCGDRDDHDYDNDGYADDEDADF